MGLSKALFRQKLGLFWPAAAPRSLSKALFRQTLGVVRPAGAPSSLSKALFRQKLGLFGPAAAGRQSLVTSSLGATEAPLGAGAGAE